MAAYLYYCESGGQMTLAVDGAAPDWATCPVCVTRECGSCEGARLQGAAPAFAPRAAVLYRCAKEHERRISLPEGRDHTPESVHCTECGGMLLPVPEADGRAG